VGAAVLAGAVALFPFLIAAWAIVAWATRTASADPEGAGPLPQWSEGLEDNPLARFEAFVLETGAELSPEERSRLRLSANWERGEVDALLDERGEVLRRFADLAAEAAQPWQWQGGGEVARFDDASPALLGVRDAALLERARSVRLAEQGEFDEALESAERLLAVGVAMQQAEGAMMHYLVGSSSFSFGLDALSRFDRLPAWTWKAPRARRTLEALEKSELRIEALRFALMAEGLAFRRIVEDLISGEASPTEDGPILDWIARRMLKPDDSLAAWLEMMGPFEEALELDWTGVALAADELEARQAAIRGNLWTLARSGNLYGRAIAASAVSPVRSVAERRFELVARGRALRLLLAIRIHEAETGGLPSAPDDLAALLPAGYLIDPFTDAPMIWDRERRLIYSTGPDQIDHGGLFEKSEPGWDVGIGY